MKKEDKETAPETGISKDQCPQQEQTDGSAGASTKFCLILTIIGNFVLILANHLF